MDSCINIKDEGFQKLAVEAGINPIILKTKVGVWQEKNNTDKLPTLAELNIDKEKLIGLGRISTKEDPDFIPLSDSSKELYQHYKLLNKEGKVKVFKTETQIKAAEKWVEFNNENAKYSFALRGPWNEKRIFIAQKFQDLSNQKQWIHNNPNPVGLAKLSTTPVTNNNDENFVNYRKYKLALVESLERNLKDYRLNMKTLENTPEYKEKIKEFNTIISNLRKEVEKMDVKDATKVFSIFTNEIDSLHDLVEKLSPEDYANFNVDDRINQLLEMFTGETILGNSVNITRIQGDGFEGFDKIISDLMQLKKEYIESYKNITESILKSNPVYLKSISELKGKELSDFEIGVAKLFDTQKDINALGGLFMGINSIDDTAATTAINLSLQYNLQKVQQTVRNTMDRISELDSILHNKKVNFEIFFAKDKHGVDTGKLVHIFSPEYFEELHKFYEAKKEFREAHYTNKMPSYRKMISWLKGNTEVIDFSKLQYFKDKYEHRYSEYFKSDDSEMSKYEENLKKTLGRYYDTLITEIEENLKNFDEYREARELQGDIYKNKDILENSPWDFVKNYNTSNATKPITTKVEDRDVQALLRGNYITFIPKESIKDVDLGYYDRKFDKVQESSETFEYWKTVKDLYTKHIDPVYTSKGYDMHTITYGKYLKSTEEMLRTRDGKLWLKKLYNENLKAFQGIWADTRKASTTTDEVAKNYNDTSLSTIKKLKEILQFKSEDQLVSMTFDRSITLEGKPKKQELIDLIARHDTLSMYSKDLTKITLALGDAATMHRTRVETSQSAEIIKRFHKSIEGPQGKERTRSIERLEAWIKTNVYNQRKVEDITKEELENTKRFGKILSDTDKTLKGLINEIRKEGVKGSTMFSYEDVQYATNKGKYFKLEGEDYVQIDKEDFETILEQYFTEEIKKRGIPINLNGLWNGVLKMIIIKGLALNPKSGIFNRAEGTITNIVRDTMGDYWTSGNLGYAKNFMAGINLYRISEHRFTPHGAKRRAQMETFMHLFEKLGVYEDKKNELDRRDNVSKFNKITKKLDIYQFAVDLPEFKNQGEIIMSMLMDLKVKDIEGNEYNFFDKKSMSFTLFEPRTTNVKAEFRTPENLGWETFELQAPTEGHSNVNDFFVARVKIDDMIKKTQGNYSKLDSIQMQDSLMGRSLMTFMRWLPEHAFQRFGTRTTDIIQGKNKVIGRYAALYNNPTALGVYATALTAMTFGPLSILPLSVVGGSTMVIPHILKMITKKNIDIDKQLILHSYDIKTLAGILQEAVTQTLNFPLNITHTKGRIGNLFKSVSLETLGNSQNSELTPAEAKALKGIAQELANSVAIIGLMIGVKTLLQGLIAGGDDDDEERERHSRDFDKILESYFYNYVSNSCDRLVTSFESWASPNTLITQNSKIAAVRALDDVAKLVEMLNKYGNGQKSSAIELIYQTNKAIPAIPIPNSISDALLKKADKVGEGQYPFFDKENMTKDKWYEKMFLDPEKRAKSDITIQRNQLRDDLEKHYQEELRHQQEVANVSDKNYELTEKEIEDIAKRQADKILKQTNKSKYESYEENIERFKESEKDIRESELK